MVRRSGVHVYGEANERCIKRKTEQPVRACPHTSALDSTITYVEIYAPKLAALFALHTCTHVYLYACKYVFEGNITQIRTPSSSSSLPSCCRVLEHTRLDTRETLSAASIPAYHTDPWNQSSITSESLI